MTTAVSDTEFGYLNGVTSAIQTQLNTKLDGTGAVGRLAVWSDTNTLSSTGFLTHSFGVITCQNIIASSIPGFSSSGGVLYAYLPSGAGSGTPVGRHHHWTSSRKYKRNIRPMESLKSKLQQLAPVRYEGTSPAGLDENGDYARDEAGEIKVEYKESFGLIAEDVREIFPELVFGITMEDGSTSLGVHYDRLPIYQIQALKEQQAEIDELKFRLAVLETR